MAQTLLIPIADNDVAPVGTERELTAHELYALSMYAHGRYQKQIAHALGISPRTVRSLLDRAEEKLGAVNHTHAVALAVSRGFVVVSL